MKKITCYLFILIGLLTTNSTGWSSTKIIAPDFTLTDINGKKVSLHDFKGKVVYLDIWATWCPPCMGQIKAAKSLKTHFKDNHDVVFLYVSIDKDLDKWREVVEDKEIKGVHLNSKNGEEDGILQKYGVSSIPKFVLINKDGSVAQWDAKWPSESGLVDDISALVR